MTRIVVRAFGLLVAVTSATLVLGLAVAETRLSSLDERLFAALEGLGGTLRLLDDLLVDPHIQNYVALVLVVAVVARVRGGSAIRTALLLAVAGTLAFAAVRAIWAVWDRDRPQELLGSVPANAHDWAPYASFPSGHVAVTTALVVAASVAAPVLRLPLWIYALVIALSRVTYGAHFPSDVLAAFVLGVTSAVAALMLVGGGAGELESDAWRAGVSRRLAPARPSPNRLLLAVGHAAAVATVVAFAVLLVAVGPPQGPEGGLFGADTETTIHRVLVAALAGAVVLAWRHPALGGGLMLLVGVTIGVLARLEYSPGAGLLACLAVFLPGLALVFSSERVRGLEAREAVLVVAMVLLAFGGVVGQRVHAAVFGPTHPESPLVPLPASAVEWVWAGRLTPTSIAVRARLEDDGAARLLVAEDESFEHPRRSRPMRAERSVNNRTVALGVHGLEPARRYVYAVEVDGVVDRTRTGTFRTPAVGPFSFTVAVAGCARTGSNGAVFDAIRGKRPLLYLILGDAFYADIARDDVGLYRDAYDEQLTSPAQSALYRGVPVAYMWDDHDFGPNDADRTSASRPAAQAAYRELVPHYPLPAGRSGPIYQAFTIGRVRFVLTDLRSARSPSATEDGRGKTMLGTVQKAWFEEELRAAKRRGQLVVWASSVPWIDEAQPGADSWAGYSAERRELATFIAENELGPLVVLGGDAHMLAIDDGSHSDYSGSGRGFPVLQAAPLDRPASVKGGPYSEGTVVESGQFGLLRVDDDGRTISVALSGHDYRGREVIAFEFDAGELP